MPILAETLSFLDDKMQPYNVRIEGRRTSIRLEPREWELLHLICRREGLSVHEFCTAAVQCRTEHSQTAKIRVAVLDYVYNTPFLSNLLSP